MSENPKKVIAIVAFEKQSRGIGFQDKIPWNIPEDLAWFNLKTRYVPEDLFIANPKLKNAVIFGRKTFASLPGPLPYRMNYVLTNSGEGSKLEEKYKGKENVLFVRDSNVKKLLDDLLTDPFINDIYICGGETIYREALPFCTECFITQIEDPKAESKLRFDTFFPELPANWQLITKTEEPCVSKNLIYVFEHWFNWKALMK